MTKRVKLADFMKNEVSEIIKAEAITVQIGKNLCTVTFDGKIGNIDTPIDEDHHRILTYLISKTAKTHTLYREGDGLYLLLKNSQEASS